MTNAAGNNGGPGSISAAPLPGMVGEHPLMREVYRRVRRFAPTELPLLLLGETGTGKELVARAIHALSPRAGAAFVPVNAAAVPPALFESAFFGHERGAFSDARASKPGLLEVADGGTLFCDELGALPADVQPKLLRAIEECAVWRVGAIRPRPATARWVAAVQSPSDGAEAGASIRPELWHRLAGAVITLPPLRERRSDIPLLVAAFVGEAKRASGEEAFQLEPGALDVLLDHGWPGNVRELRLTIQRAAALAERGWLDRATVEEAVAAPALSRPRAGSRSPAALRRLLAVHGGDTAAAARAAGVGVSTLYRWLHQAGLDSPRQVNSHRNGNCVRTAWEWEGLGGTSVELTPDEGAT
jgi:DNA-binding NtrC family response regulator